MLPDITIFRLLDHGCRVEIVDPEDHELPMAIVWDATDDTFRDYIEFFGKIKADEDAKPKEERNPAQREFGKITLNGQSGKPGQRAFDTRNVIYTSEQVEKARAKIKEGIEQKDPLQAYLVAQNFMMVKQKKNRITRYPVQLSEFIYAYARDYMWVELFSRAHIFNSRVLNSDTDSGFITEAQLNDLRVRGKLLDGANQKKEFGLFEVEAVINKLAVGGPKFYCANKVIINGDTVIEDGEKLRIKGVRNTDKIIVDGVDYPVSGNGMMVLERKVANLPVTIKSFSIYKDHGRIMYRDIIKNL